MSVLSNFDTNANFWELNPQLKIPKEFNTFYVGDKSKNKAHSSKIMWAIAQLIDNSEENKFRNLLHDDRKLLLSEDFLEIPDFDWDAYANIIEAYISLNMSKSERSLLIYETKLEERDTFIKDTDYTLDNAASLDKIISATKSIYELIKKLRDDIKKEKDVGETKGAMEESASEKGLL